MTTLGPILLNKGWISDMDIYNPPPGNNGAMTFTLLDPYQGGAKVMENLAALAASSTQIPNASKIRGFFYWQDPAQEGVASTDIVMALSAQKIYTTNFTTSTIAWTDRTAAVTLPTGGLYTFDVLNGNVLIANGSSNTGPWKLTTYNGNIALLGGSPPPASIVKVVNNFAFLGLDLSSTAKLSRVSWSNVGDPNTWTAANFVDVNLNDGDIITALSSIGTDLIIFKTNSIWRLSTITTTISGSVTLGPLSNISTQNGCVGPLAVDTLPDGTLVFLAANGHLYQTDGTIFKDLSHQPWPSSNIRSGVDRSIPPTQVTPKANFSPIYNAIVRVDSSFSRVFLQVAPTSGTASPRWVYSYVYDSWSDWTSLDDGTDQVSYIQEIPLQFASNVNFGGTSKSLSLATVLGFIFQTGGSSASSTKTIGNLAPTCTYETTVSLGGNVPNDFIPRSLIVPLGALGVSGGIASAVGTIQIFVGLDGIYPSSPNLNVSLSSITGGRARVSIPYSASTTIHPLTLQVKIILKGNVPLSVIMIEPFYVSDEILT